MAYAGRLLAIPSLPFLTTPLISKNAKKHRKSVLFSCFNRNKMQTKLSFFFLTGEAQHIDTPYLEVPVRFNMPIYAFLHNVLLVRKLNPHTKLQCSKTWQWRQLKSLLFFVSETATEMPYHHYARPSDRKRQHISFYRISSVFLCNDFRHKKAVLTPHKQFIDPTIPTNNRCFFQ